MRWLKGGGDVRREGKQRISSGIGGGGGVPGFGVAMLTRFFPQYQ